MEMRIELYEGNTLSDPKMSKVFVLSVAMRSQVVCRNNDVRCTVQQTANPSKKKKASVGVLGGWGHWYPIFSGRNHIPIPCEEESTWMVRVECPWSSSCQTIESKKKMLSELLTCSTNHVSSHQTAELIFILPHICVLPVIFMYMALRVGLSHG